MVDPYYIINKYYKKDTPLFDLLVSHSEKVRNKALDIVDKHPEFDLDVDFVSEASMLHDIGIYKCKAPKIFCVGNHHYIEHGYLGADILRSEGLPKHALVCERHTGTGLSLDRIIKNKLPLPHRDMLPVSLEEEIICYADKFYSKSRPDRELTVDEIIESIARYGDEGVLKFMEWHNRFK
ncbi:HDIG domain-containing protein [Paludibacter sp.]